MAISFVSRIATGELTGSRYELSTSAQSHTSGNLLVVLFSYQSEAFTSLTDTAGNSFTSVASVSAGINVLRIYYAKNITGHASNVITLSIGGQGFAEYWTIVVYEFSGIDTTTPLVDYKTATGNSTSIATSALTVSGSESVVLGWMEADGRSFSAGSGFTATVGNYFQDEYKVVTSNTAATAGCGSGPWGIVAASFKASTSSSAQGAALHHYRQQGMMRHQQPRLILPSRELITELPLRRLIENRLAI